MPYPVERRGFSPRMIVSGGPPSPDGLPTLRPELQLLLSACVPARRLWAKAVAGSAWRWRLKGRRRDSTPTSTVALVWTVLSVLLVRQHMLSPGSAIQGNNVSMRFIRSWADVVASHIPGTRRHRLDRALRSLRAAIADRVHAWEPSSHERREELLGRILSRGKPMEPANRSGAAALPGSCGDG